jgi:hypothetical protein
MQFLCLIHLKKISYGKLENPINGEKRFKTLRNALSHFDTPCQALSSFVTLCHGMKRHDKISDAKKNFVTLL